ncbi:putative membrane protein [Prescottella agglutinans]|uniref:Membrane protein n=1 Tax=Prescottella agglutinans TaxID=1644129 RepID=A0ABT6MKX8_9NOCA|nr:putative membrane protein [Prescottella agglutinans]
MGRVLVVLMLAAVSLIGIGTGVASAGGFDCKDVPKPEFPNEVLETTFDSTSADRAHGGGTGYQTYGWAGLKWHTYDLGCGADLVRAPGAVGDTTLGNTFMTIGKSMAAAAFWLDDQTKTGQAAADAGVEPALAKFDQIVFSISKGMRSIYGQWIGIGLVVVAAIVLWKALKADAAGVTRTTAFAAAGLALGALMVGAPQKALQVADDTFGSLITETQEQIFSVQFGDDGGTLAGGASDPRNVLIDKIYLDDWRKGWFGQNYDSTDAAGLGPKLRDSLAFTYDQQHEVKDDPKAQSKLAEEKADKFREIVSSLEDDYQLSYHQFQGKDSGRTSIGFMGMLKLAMPSLLWIGASLLKLVALLAIRFAVLFAPIWIPIAIAYGGWLSRVMRMLASAYMWGVAGAVIVALYLMALVQLYVGSNGTVDGSWRLWFMILLTVVCWAIMRPFKRMSQTFSQNSASMVNRKARGAKQAIKRKAFAAAAATVGGPGAGAAAGKIADKATERWGRRTSGEIAGPDGAPTRPEGRALNNQRQQALTQSRADARKAQLGRAGRLGQAAEAASERDARIAGIAAVASRDMARGQGGVDGKDAEHAIKSGSAAWKRFDQDEASAKVQENRARKELLTASVGQRWDGGDRSAIAPMTVFTPSSSRVIGDATAKAFAASSSRRKPPPPPAAAARVWTASNPGTRGKDRYL